MEADTWLIVGQVGVEELASALAGCRRVDLARRRKWAAADLVERGLNWYGGCVLGGVLDVGHCETLDVTFLAVEVRELC